MTRTILPVANMRQRTCPDFGSHVGGNFGDGTDQSHINFPMQLQEVIGDFNWQIRFCMTWPGPLGENFQTLFTTQDTPAKFLTIRIEGLTDAVGFFFGGNTSGIDRTTIQWDLVHLGGEVLVIFDYRHNPPNSFMRLVEDFGQSLPDGGVSAPDFETLSLLRMGAEAGAVPADNFLRGTIKDLVFIKESRVVAHYPFSETSGTMVNDISGNENHATLVSNDPANFWSLNPGLPAIPPFANQFFWSLDNENGGIPAVRNEPSGVYANDWINTGTWREQQPGRCYEFGGVNGNKVTIPQITNGISQLAAFFRVKSTWATWRTMLFGSNTDDFNSSFWFSNNNNQRFLNFRALSSQFVGTNLIPINIWCDVGFYYNAGSVTLYVEDTTEDGTVIPTTITTLADCLLGGLATISLPFGGHIREAVIWEGVNPNWTDFRNGIVSGNPKYHFKCDEGSGTTAYDSSGNGNHGTITAASISIFHNTTVNDQYSWQNEVGYTRGIRVAGNSLGFVSRNVLSGDFSVKFTYASGSVSSLGVGPEDEPWITTGVPGVYNLRTSGGNVIIRLNTTSLATVASITGDIWEIERSGTDLYFRKNGVLEHTETGVATDDWYIGGFLTNGSIPTVWYPDLTLTLASGVTEEETFAPRDESDTANDVLGSPLDYSGQVPRSPRFENMPCGTFDQVGDVAQFAGTNGIISSSMSFGGWIKGTNNTGTKGIFAKAASAANTQWSLFQNGTSMVLRVGGTGKDVSVAGQDFTDGFQHWFATINGTTGKIYKNGVEVASGTMNAMPADNGTDVIIGALSNLPGFPFGGNVFGAMFWGSTVLTPVEILALYQTGTMPATSPDLLVPFTEQSGLTVYDASGNGNHGTLTTASEATFWASKQDVYRHPYGCWRAMVFDRVDDQISLPSWTTPAVFSIVCEFVPFAISAPSQRHFVSEDLDVAGFNLFLSATGNATFRTSAAAANTMISSVNIANINQKNISIADYDGADSHVWLNNGVGDFGLSANYAQRTGTATISVNATTQCGGHILRIRIYDKVLSAGERSVIWAGGDVTAGKIHEWVGHNNTVASWADRVGSLNAVSVDGTPRLLYVPGRSDGIAANGQYTTHDKDKLWGKMQLNYNPVANAGVPSGIIAASPYTEGTDDDMANQTQLRVDDTWVDDTLVGGSNGDDRLLGFTNGNPTGQELIDSKAYTANQ